MQKTLPDLRAHLPQRDAMRLYLPLVADQAITSFVSIIGTIMVGHAGNAAISAVGVVNSLNFVIQNAMVSLAAGVAAVTAQFLGARQRDRAARCVGQFFSAMMLLILVISLALIIFARPILYFLFREAEPAVLEGAHLYLIYSAASLPFIICYSTISAVLRGCGNTRTPMLVGLAVNVLYTILCVVTIYGLHMGVAGAAVSLVINRICAGGIMLFLLFRPGFVLKVTQFFPIRWADLRPIARIGVPMSIDSGMFQGGKLLVQVFLSGMGTAAMAANAVAVSVVSLIEISGNAMCLLTVMLVGYAVGAGDYLQARFHNRSTTVASCLIMTAVCVPLWFLTPFLNALFTGDPEVLALSVRVVRSMVLFSPVLWSTAFVIPSGLRAAGDVRYTVGVSLAVMWLCRVVLSWVFGVLLGWGLLGVWMAMYADWVARTVFYIPRFSSRRWENRAVT